MSLDSELVLAVTGVLKPTAIDADVTAASSALLDAYERRLTRWVRGTESDPFEPPKERDLRKTRLQAQAVVAESTLRELLKPLIAVDPALAVEYQADLLRARTVLDKGYPLETVESVMGPEEMPPAWDKAKRWLAVVAVVEDPDRILDEFEMGSLEPAQVSGFKACYPELWAWLWRRLMKELISMRAESMRAQARGKPATTLPFDREATVRLFGETGFATPLDIPEEKAEASESRPHDIDASEQQTPGERTSRPL